MVLQLRFSQGEAGPDGGPSLHSPGAHELPVPRQSEGLLRNVLGCGPPFPTTRVFLAGGRKVPFPSAGGATAWGAQDLGA